MKFTQTPINTAMASYSTIDPPDKKSKVKLHFQRGKTKRIFKSADVRTGDPSYGPESKTKDTPEFVKKAQKAGADVAEHNGKPYRAGYTTITKEPDKHSVTIDHTPSIPKRAPSGVEMSARKKKMSEIRQKYGAGKKRRLDRVEWLEGRNKKTESGHGM